MRKIKQILLYAVLLACTAFLCSESAADEPLNQIPMADARAFCIVADVGQRQIGDMPEPALSVESSQPPLVGSALADLCHSAASEPGGGQAKEQTASSSAEPKAASKKTKKKAKKAAPQGTEYVLPSGLGLRKSLESYTAITDRTSEQYRMQQNATTNALGLRKYQKRYMVAVGTYFHAPVGAKIDVFLTGGSTLKCIVGDIKSDADTVGGLTQRVDGSVVEFIVDWRRIERDCKRLGSMHALDEFDGYVEKIVVYDTP